MDDYTVRVQPRGSQEWMSIDTYMAKVNAGTEDGKHRVYQISFSQFDFSGVVNVQVICKKKKYQTARIRPDYRGVIANIKNDSVLQFTLFQPENVSVEFDGDISNNLLLFTSRPPISKAEAERQAKSLGRQFISYAPGYYNDKDTIFVPSNTTIYLEEAVISQAPLPSTMPMMLVFLAGALHVQAEDTKEHMYIGHTTYL